MDDPELEWIKPVSDFANPHFSASDSYVSRTRSPKHAFAGGSISLFIHFFIHTPNTQIINPPFHQRIAENVFAV